MISSDCLLRVARSLETAADSTQTAQSFLSALVEEGALAGRIWWRDATQHLLMAAVGDIELDPAALPMEPGMTRLSRAEGPTNAPSAVIATADLVVALRPPSDWTASDVDALLPVVVLLGRVVGDARRVEQATAYERDQSRLVAALPTVWFRVSADGIVTHSEGGGLASLGLEPGQVVGENVFDLYPNPETARLIRTVLGGEAKTWSAEVEERCWETVALPSTDSAGVTTGMTAAATDVTDREAASRNAAESKARFERVLVATPDAVVLAGVDRTIEFVNPGFTRLFGYAPEDVMGSSTEILYADPDAAAEQGRTRYQPDSSDQFDPYVVQYRRRDGTTFSGETVGVPIRDAQEQAIGFAGVVRDVTEREAAIRALDRERRRYIRLVENANDLILQVGADGDILFVNAATRRAFGYERHDLIGRMFLDLILPEHRAEAGEFYDRQLRAGAASTRREVPVEAHDGQVIWLDLNVVLVESDGKMEFHAVARDVTEQHIRAQEEARIAREASEAALRAKETFLANVSHEMRTPLHAVLGLSRLLAGGVVSASQTSLVHGISRAGDTLLVLINDLLDRARLDADRLDFAETPFFIGDVLNDVRVLLVPGTADKGIGLVVESPDGVDMIVGDPARLRQILLNLGGNAVKFTSKGSVTIRATVMSRDTDIVQVRFDIQDTGIGISDEEQEKIFDAFAQVRDNAARRYGGTGLGLSIVRDLVERQGGRIDVESVEGVGSTFSVYLDFETAPFESVDPVDDDDDGPDLSGIRALVVEDNPTNRLIARLQLEAWDVEVVEAAGGQEALDRLTDDTAGIDVVLMDLQMPGMDGIEATHRIRNDLGLRDLPVVALTASALASRRGTTIGAGFSDFVLKPFEPDDLHRRLALVLGRARPRASDVRAIDIERLRSSALSDPIVERRLATLFVTEVATRAPRMIAAAAIGHLSGVRTDAHALKGQAGYVGANDFAIELARIEDAIDGALVTGVGLASLVELVSDVTTTAAEATRALCILYPPTP